MFFRLTFKDVISLNVRLFTLKVMRRNRTEVILIIFTNRTVEGRKLFEKSIAKIREDQFDSIEED